MLASRLIIIVSLMSAYLIGPMSLAQDADLAPTATVDDQIENINFVNGEIDKEERQHELQEKKNEPTPMATMAPQEKKEKKIKSGIEYSGVNSVRPAADLAIVQKTLMPKTDRFFYSLGAAIIPNDVFYKTMGVSGRFGYFLNETWGIDIHAHGFTSITGSDIYELQGNEQVAVQNLVSLQYFYGAELLWVPLYGKAAFFNRKIYPFEIYGSLGVDSVTTSGSAGNSGIKVGFGEIFSIDKKNSIRLDLSYLYYNSINALGQQTSTGSIILTMDFMQFLTTWKQR